MSVALDMPWLRLPHWMRRTHVIHPRMRNFYGTVPAGPIADAIPAPPAFTPLSIAGCVLWMDMQDPASYTQAGTVTSITNKASSVAWTEATNPPTYSATGLSSQPCMDFNGTTQRIISTEAAVFAVLTNAHAFTIFFVAAFDTIDRFDAAFGVGNSGVGVNSIRFFGQSTLSSGRWLSTLINDAGTTVDAVGTAQSDTPKHIHIWHSPGTTSSLNLDNGAANPNAAAQDPGTLTPNRSALGCKPRTTPNNFFDGRCGEWIMYDTELSASDITSVYSYLIAKWP